MTKPVIKVNSAGVADLLSSAGVVNDLLSRGNRVAAAMASSAPVDTGALARSHTVRAVRHPTRTVVQVGSDLPYALAVAARTGYMARALDAGT